MSLTPAEKYELRARLASRFDVPDGGRYANDWAGRLDAVLLALDEAQQS